MTATWTPSPIFAGGGYAGICQWWRVVLVGVARRWCAHDPGSLLLLVSFGSATVIAKSFDGSYGVFSRVDRFQHARSQPQTDLRFREA
jgi:hypothetical protein